MPTTDEVIKKYSNIIESKFNSYSPKQSFSSDYTQFKEEMVPNLTSYEKWTKSLGNLISINVAQKDKERIEGDLKTAHLDVSASQVITLSIVSLFAVFLLTILACVGAYIINPEINISNLVLFGFLGFLAALFLFYYSYSMPKRLANFWRMRASSEMVPAILYVVVYMKHTSNLERAIEFASQHLEGPLALDFKKVFYDVEIGKFSTIKQSLDNYLETWRTYAPEFIESFHLIESSLYEPSEARRVQILEKALQIILDGIYEKMLKYSRDVRSPLTNIYMLGIILPTLGLALLPLASTLLGGILRWPHVFLIFNIIIPFMVFYMASEVLFKRPGGHGESSVLELNPNYEKFKDKKPWIIASLIAIPFILIALLPFILNSPIADAIGVPRDFLLEKTGLSFLGTGCVFDFKTPNGMCGNGNGEGPFGTIAVLLSLLFPLGIAIFFSYAYSRKTKDLIKDREKTKILEEEFTNSMFQLGNRLGDGIPAEIAFAKVAESTKGQITQSFFSLVNQNISQAGMSLEAAIFDKNRGAITYYPSSLISTSMKILVESVKKGLQIAAQSLMSISEYVKNISKINQRLKDLLAEVISDMKSNMTFLAPLLAGIVTGLATMITIILNKIDYFIRANPEVSTESYSSLTNIMSIFKVSGMIPPYFLQIIVGIYIIEIVFILNYALTIIDSGKDTLREKYDLARYLKTSMILYLITAFLSTLLLSILAGFALKSGLGI
jgi:Flp pilus assembly protein TadB